MVTIIGVRFRVAGKIYYFDPGALQIGRNGKVIVETARGLEMGTVMVPNKEVAEDSVVQPLKPVIRIATEEDLETVRKNKEKEQEAFRICQEKIRKHELEMKLVDVEYTFDNNKILFYFTADGRIDFRELVKDLASVFKTRIELRQIGVRDETKIMGGIGICGRPLCCHSYLAEFIPVSIKMAKEQNLSLNPTKISGVCGRLMCCLKNEEETYEYLNSRLPSLGDVVTHMEDGVKGTVQSVNVLRQTVKVVVNLEGDDLEVREYPIDELKYRPRRRKDKNSKEIESEVREKDKEEKEEKAEKTEWEDRKEENNEENNEENSVKENPNPMEDAETGADSAETAGAASSSVPTDTEAAERPEGQASENGNNPAVAEKPAQQERRPRERSNRREYNRGSRGEYGDRQRSDRSDRPDNRMRNRDENGEGQESAAGRENRPERRERNYDRRRNDRGERGEYNDRRRNDRGERIERNDRSEYSDRQRDDRSERAERMDRSEYSDRQRGDRSERAERMDRSEYSDRQRGDRPERYDRNDRGSYGDRRPRGRRPENGERSNRENREENGERPRRERYGAKDYAERTERNDRPNRTDRPERGEYGDRRPRGRRSESGERNNREKPYRERQNRPVQEERRNNPGEESHE